MASAPLSPPPSAAMAAALRTCAAVLLPGDPPRSSRIAFWRPDGTAPLPPSFTGEHGPGEEVRLTVALPSGSPDPSGSDEKAGPKEADAAVRLTEVPAWALTVGSAVPVLTRARSAGGHPAAVYWGAVAVVALQLAARGRLLPGVSPGDHDAWRVGPLDPEDRARLSDLARAMPAHAHAVPREDGRPPAAGEVFGAEDQTVRLPAPEELIRSFLDAVADGLPRSPAAPLATGSPLFTAEPPRRAPRLRPWAAEVAAGYDAGVRLSLRVEADAVTTETGPTFRAVLQAHSLSDAAQVCDAAELWSGASRADAAAGARTQALLTLRRAASAWAPLERLLADAVPDAIDLDDDEVSELLGAPASGALSTAGIEVHWPRRLFRTLTSTAEVGGDAPGSPRDGDRASRLPSFLSPDAVLSFSWHVALGDERLSREELHRLAEARRPVVRLRDQWVLVDPVEVRRALHRKDRAVTPAEALRAALTGRTTQPDGTGHEVTAAPWLEALRERLSDPDRRSAEALPPPTALHATLRDYQLRGLDWMHRMTSLGLGCCLADDMGLGKTVTVIALHLRRHEEGVPTGPTLVVCPASLMANWQREIERFAPGTAVRRFHGTARDLSGAGAGDVVLTTYGTLRRDAERLSAVPWDLVVADEAQHVKNPHAATSRALRAVPATARVALSGTPVENNLTELWAILDWAAPGLLGTLGAFRREHADGVESGEDPAAAHRLARLTAPFLLRRRKSDPGIAPELPPKTETDRVVPLTAEQTALYEAVVREGLAALSGTEGIARRGLVVTLLTSLKQICNHPAQYLKEDRPRLAGRSGKLELFDELVDTVRAEGAATLVFTQYVAMARLLSTHLAERDIPSLLLHGGTPVARREELVRAFQEGAAPVFLLSLKAAGTGLNLTRAEHVVHFDRWWNPAVESQATDRAYRIGQDRPVQVHRLVTEGTVEDRIAAMLRRKQALADSVLARGDGALTELSDTDLAELVELRGGAR